MRRVKQACLLAFGLAQARVREIAGEVVQDVATGGRIPVDEAVLVKKPVAASTIALLKPAGRTMPLKIPASTPPKKGIEVIARCGAMSGVAMAAPTQPSATVADLVRLLEDILGSSQ